MDAAALLRAAADGRLPPLVLIAGGDAQLLDDTLAMATRGLFVGADDAALGREVLDGTVASVDEVIRAAQTLPFLSARRLVAVRRAQALPAKGADALAAYARDPNPATCLLLLADEPLAGGRDRKDHWLLAAVPAAAVATPPPRHDRGAEDWLRERAALEGLTVAADAARLLVQWIGDDGAALLGEARKAALAGGPDNRSVGVREVRAVVGEHRLAEVWDLSRAIGRRDARAALAALDRLLATEDAMRLLAIVTADVRAALAITDMRARGQSTDEIARATRKSPQAVQAIARGAERVPVAAWQRRLERCWEVERRLKSSGQARAEMAALVAELSAAR